MHKPLLILLTLPRQPDWLAVWFVQCHRRREKEWTELQREIQRERERDMERERNREMERTRPRMREKEIWRAVVRCDVDEKTAARRWTDILSERI